MKKKIVILTESPNNLQEVHEQLMGKNFEVMKSTSVLEECVSGEFSFVKRFDLIIIDEATYSKIPASTYAGLNDLNIPLIILSHEVLANGKDQLYISYPTSISGFMDQIDVLTSKARVDNAVVEVVETQQNMMYEDVWRNEQQAMSVYRAFPERTVARMQPIGHMVERPEPKRIRYAFQVINHSLIIEGYPIVLSPKELELFQCLMKAGHALVNNKELFEQIWDSEYHASKQPFLSNLIMKIRKKVCEEYQIADSIIINQKGIGYKINDKFRSISNS